MLRKSHAVDPVAGGGMPSARIYTIWKHPSAIYLERVVYAVAVGDRFLAGGGGSQGVSPFDTPQIDPHCARSDSSLVVHDKMPQILQRIMLRRMGAPGVERQDALGPLVTLSALA